MTDKEMWSQPSGDLLVNVHPATACGDKGCPLHKPSDHHMVDWPLNWRQFDGIVTIKLSHFERICPHGIGHPDPDSARWLAEHDEDVSIHGCDGCCATPV